MSPYPRSSAIIKMMLGLDLVCAETLRMKNVNDKATNNILTSFFNLFFYCHDLQIVDNIDKELALAKTSHICLAKACDDILFCPPDLKVGAIIKQLFFDRFVNLC